MKKSDYTKKAISKLRFAQTVDFLLLVVPVFVYSIMGIVAEGRAVYEKVTFISSIFIALLLLLLNVLMKKRLRSPIWIVIIGLYVVLDNIMPLIIIIAITSVIDELILTPYIQKAKVSVVANKEIDKRQ